MSHARSPSPSDQPDRSKRAKLESPKSDAAEDVDMLDTPEGSGCIICLQPIIDRTVLPECSHDEFCFECVLLWSSKLPYSKLISFLDAYSRETVDCHSDQSRKCPLCSHQMGPYLIHHIRSDHDYQKHFLAPLRTSPVPSPSRHRPLLANNAARRRRRQPENWGGAPNTRADAESIRDALDRAIEKRKWVYRHNLFAKVSLSADSWLREGSLMPQLQHMASNAFTRYRPYPTPTQIAASEELISRATAFVRRELRVWVNLDVEFLTSYVVSLLKSMDIRFVRLLFSISYAVLDQMTGSSEPAVRALAEFLDLGWSLF